MIKLKDKTALITGASSGIGKACAEQFASLGCNLILAARRIERLEKLAEDLKSQYNIQVLTIQLDVQDRNNVKTAIENLPASFQKIDILVNNAGLALGSDKIQDGKIENWDTMIGTNVRGLLYVTHYVLPGMISHNAGHIMNIGSVAGHEYYSGGNVYSATKHAVKAISRSLRIDLLGKAIRVTEIDPGAVETEFSEVRWKDKDRAKEFYKGFEPLVANDIADAVVYCATRPEHVNIAEMQIFPVHQASANHLYKEGQEAKSLFEK